MNLRNVLFAAMLLLAACSSDHAVVRGSLHDSVSADVASAWVVGGPEMTAVSGAQPFEVTTVVRGPVDLRLAGTDGETARMVIGPVPAESRLTLERIRVDPESGRAFPSAVRFQGAGPLLINGVRMGDPSALPAQVDLIGSVLAMSEDTDALLLRPRGDTLPDLRVVVTDSTRWVLPDGSPASPTRLEYGDSLHVLGPSDAGYVYAEQLRVFPRMEPGEDAGSEAGGRSPLGRILNWLRGRSGSERPAGDEMPERRAPAPEGERTRGPTGRGAPRSDAADIPPGHRPPPGHCRDWNPSLPPGQQPAPYKC